MDFIRIVISACLLWIAISVTPTVAAGLTNQQATAGQPSVLYPLDGSEFSEKAVLSAPVVQREGDAVSVSKNGRFLLYVPKVDATDPTTITVKVKDGSNPEISHSFLVELKKSATQIELTDEQLKVIGAQLLLLLVLSILLESGLSVLFNYRYFLVFLDGRGWKTPISFIVSLIFVFGFGINTVGEVLKAFGLVHKDDLEWPSQFVTALILTGGSSLIFQLFEMFGLRSPLRRRAESDEVRSKARLKIRLTRQKVSPDREVLISVDGKALACVEAREADAPRNRFHPGYLVEAGTRKITLTGYKAVNVQKRNAVSGALEFEANGEPKWERDEKENIVTRLEKVEETLEHGFAPGVSVPMRFIL